MATDLSLSFSKQPRNSTETDRRQLLAESIAPSDSVSMVTDITGDGDRTPRANSPASSTRRSDIDLHFQRPTDQHFDAGRDTIADSSSVPEPYKGFPSEAHYLAALNQWAESKKYIDSGDSTLIGFYGTTSMEEYASRPAQDFGIKKKWRARKEAKRHKEEAKTSARRNTVT